MLRLVVREARSRALRRKARMIEGQRQRWEQLRRALINVVAQQHAADPSSRFTLDIRIVPKEPASKVA